MQYNRKGEKMKKSLIAISLSLMFILTSTVSAQVVGIYDMVSSGSCIHSQSAFTKGTDANGFDYYAPNGTTWGATTSAVGTWEFYSNGTGKADIWNYPIDYPPGSSLGPRARSQHLLWDTKWVLNKDIISIKMYVPDGTFTQQRGEIVGSVSLDKKTLIIPTVLQQLSLGDPLYYAVCNTMRTFIRVGNVD
jgi:hypothetical protein